MRRLAGWLDSTTGGVAENEPNRLPMIPSLTAGFRVIDHAMKSVHDTVPLLRVIVVGGVADASKPSGFDFSKQSGRIIYSMPAGQVKTLHPGSRFKSVCIRSFLCRVVPVPGCSRFQVTPGSRSSQVIPGHPRSSQVIPGHPRSSQVIPGHPRSSQGAEVCPRPLWPVY